MKTINIQILILISIISLYSCSNIKETSQKEYAYIKYSTTENSKTYIKVDYVNYYIGEDAEKAEWDEKAYFVDGYDTISNITNGYYISNNNTILKTLEVPKNLHIKNIIDDKGIQKINKPKLLDSVQINTYIKSGQLLIIELKEEKIISIKEQFLP